MGKKENREHLELCFWNQWWGDSCFCLWIWPFCTGKVCQMTQQVLVPWGQWAHPVPAYSLLAALPGELCTFAQAWGRVWPRRGAAAPRCVWESSSSHWDLGCYWQRWRQPQSVQPDNALLTPQPAFLSIPNYSKQSWQKFKLPSLSWEVPFPFSLPHHTPLASLVRLHAWTCPWQGTPSHSVPRDLVTCWHMWAAATGHTGGFVPVSAQKLKES